MLTQITTSYTEKNINSKMGVQCAMLVGTNKTVTVRRLRMTPTKRAKKGRGESEKLSLLIRTLKALKREKFPLL
jgi:hypothetical protein